MKLIFNQPRGK
jgi:hypothetical protein